MMNHSQGGNLNPAYVHDIENNVNITAITLKDDQIVNFNTQNDNTKRSSEEIIVEDKNNERQSWGSGMEFLMSCIAMSIGLGNVWRFPFTAYENGGGVFLIPYIIVLFLIGKPFYYLEMILGQFTSRSSVKSWNCVPGLHGIGWAQSFSMASVGTYYCSLMSVTLIYLFGSFSSPLPWAKCLSEWGDNCVDSLKHENSTIIFKNATNMKSSAELYFTKSVLKEKENIDDGIGMPDWKLTLCLFAAWLCIFGVLARGLKSSGKAAYFLAFFPYVIMIALLIRAVTLEGASKGIIFFIKPDWSKLFDPNVWYAAVTQCFFSLSVCFGGVIMYSSYNNFNHNIYRDAMVVTTLDTFTSLMAGFTIFGILGNLAHELGVEDMKEVVKGGTGLAFISYPDAIAKFSVMPQVFSVLFFLMLFVLGIGSAIALAGGVIAIICDQFPQWKYWKVVLAVCLSGFIIGTSYCTPGGQFILNMVDYYAASFIVFVFALFEITGIFWVYGLENFIEDVEFMLKRKPSAYWRISWAIVTPLLLTTILIYTLISLEPLKYSGVLYPDSLYTLGWSIFTFGIIQLPFWMIYTIVKTPESNLLARIVTVFRPNDKWGPNNSSNHTAWRQFKETNRKRREIRTSSKIKQFLYVLIGHENDLL